MGTALASRLGIASLTIDDVVTAVQAVTTPETHPGFHLMWQTSHLDYFTHTPAERLIEDAQRQHTAAWPMIKAVIGKRARFGKPIVIDGWHLWPKRVAALPFDNIWAGWIHIDPAVLHAREEQIASWHAGSADPDQMLANFMGRSLWFNDFYKREAAAHHLAVIEQDGQQSVDDLIQRVMEMTS